MIFDYHKVSMRLYSASSLRGHALPAGRQEVPEAIPKRDCLPVRQAGFVAPTGLLAMTLVYLVAFFPFILFGGEAMAFRIESPAFGPHEKIPQKYTCDADDVSPPLRWSDVPEGTKSFALISDDPDAPGGTWVHWVIYNIPADAEGLPEGVAKMEALPNGAKQGVTDFRRVGYGGPCPPPGKPHRYFFKLYALNRVLALPSKTTKADLLISMNDSILAQAELVGTYQRS